MLTKIILRTISQNKKFSFKSQGNSMFPLLHSGDRIYFEKCSFKSYRTNDLILIKKNKRLMIHRVIYIGKDYLICKGDNNKIDDGLIYAKNVIAKAVKINRKGKIIDLDNIYLLQSTIYFQTLVQIIKFFAEENINYVILKGLPLHLYFEKTHPRRLFADIDILVNKMDFGKVEMIFKKNGFRRITASYSLMHKLLKNKLTEISFAKKIKGFPIVFDIHIEANFLMNQLGRLDALYSQSNIDLMTTEFLQRKKKIKVRNETFYILHLPDLIFYLSMHFFHHNFRGIFRLELIAKIISKSGTSNEQLNQISELVRKYKVKYYIYPVSVLLKKYFSELLLKQDNKNFKMEKNKLNYINKNILMKNPFAVENRIEEGVRRFKILFTLSDETFFRKMLIFFTPAVLYSVLWVLWKKIDLRHKLFYLWVNN